MNATHASIAAQLDPTDAAALAAVQRDADRHNQLTGDHLAAAIAYRDALVDGATKFNAAQAAWLAIRGTSRVQKGVLTTDLSTGSRRNYRCVLGATLWHGEWTKTSQRECDEMVERCLANLDALVLELYTHLGALRGASPGAHSMWIIAKKTPELVATLEAALGRKTHWKFGGLIGNPTKKTAMVVEQVEVSQSELVQALEIVTAAGAPDLELVAFG